LEKKTLSLSREREKNSSSAWNSANTLALQTQKQIEEAWQKGGKIVAFKKKPPDVLYFFYSAPLQLFSLCASAVFFHSTTMVL
jgi:hypothetical protein